MNNPLLEDHVLPPFKQIKPEHVEVAINQLIKQNLQAIDEIARNPNPNWEKTIEPIEALEDQLSKAWSPVSHLNAVVNTPALREAYNNCLPKLSDYGTQIGQNEKLFEAYVAIKDSTSFAQLNVSQQKVITNAIRDFKLSGVALAQDKREQFAKLSQELSQLQSQFQDNVMDATDDFYLDLESKDMLKGIPETALEIARKNAEKANVQGYRLTLDYPCYHAVITYAEDSDLRQKMHFAYATRASELGNKKWDNTALMEKIVAKRHQKAQLLGFKNYAELSLATKMAKKTETVMVFLQDLANKAKKFAEKEVAELAAFAKKEFQVDKLAPWDIAYYSEKLRQNRYAVSQEMLRPYFPTDKVLAGMFEVVKRLYNINIRLKVNDNTWHPDVQFFEVWDSENQLRGQFYLDLYARSQKRGGAWMDEARVRRKVTTHQMQLPVAYLTCNFSPRVDDKPSLLTFDEVETLFHEFGHGLHHLLTKIDYAPVSGINGVPWDAVELPSQFMENWCWQNEALAFISSHFETQEPLPTELLKKMQQAKNFQSGILLLRQLEFSLFDFRLHLEYTPEEGAKVQEILDEVRAQYSVLPPATYNRFQHSFSHIFSGGYAAGYYSYLWAEVLSSDAFAKFEEEGIFNAKIGKAFLENILEKGGSLEPEILFKNFRGREPDISHLLRHRQLVD